jgi:two-component system CheB/CheR fusion protein
MSPDLDAGRLVSAIQELSYLRDLGGVMEVVRRTAREITGADGVTFVLREGDQVFYAEENAIAPLWKGRRFPASVCISGWVIQNGTPAVIEDIYADARVPVDAYASTFVKSLAVVPVRPADPIGAIGAYWATHHRADEREIQVLSTLAGSTAIALANAELYQEAHAARAAAEAASRAKDDFLAVLSHELRTPLTSILAWGRILRTKRLDAGQLVRAGEIIERNALAQTQVVESLLDSSLILAGRFELALAEVDLGEIAREACAGARAAASAKDIALALAEPGEPLPVGGDAARLRQVIEAVLANALKFTPPGGRIDVDLGRAQAHVELCVRDTGMGIEPAFLPYVFDRFRQEDGGKTRRHGGLGLSLSLARHIIERHGGTISIESAGRGHGTTVLVSLPTR